jgi:lactonase family protein with 7-bladed beta-propeller
MFKKTDLALILGASGVLVSFLLPGGSNFGRVQGATAQQQQAAQPGTAPATSGEVRKTTRLQRSPLRTIEDPNPSFSAVAVDVARDEIALEDENRDEIAVYGRLDNTPAQAALTEPKRTIGGSKTRISENCGLYVDPFSGDIYTVNGDTANYLTVWSHEQKGNSVADRTINTPHRGFAIAIDEQAKELFLTIESPPAVVVYPKMAQGNDVPLRILEGDKTQLAEVHGIALDLKNQLMYVVNQGPTSSNTDDGGWARDVKPGSPTVEWTPDSERWKYLVPGSGKVMPPSITVYPMKASGDAAPVRIIQGPLTQLDWPVHISLDADRQELFVANSVADDILVFRATDNGNVAPIRVLKGPHTGLGKPHGVFVDTKNNELVVANFGNHSSTVYARDAKGDTPPLRTIRAAPANTPAPMFGNIGTLSYDTKRDQLLVPN